MSFLWTLITLLVAGVLFVVYALSQTSNIKSDCRSRKCPDSNMSAYYIEGQCFCAVRPLELNSAKR